MARQIDMEISIDTTKSEIKMQKLQDELRRLKKKHLQWMKVIKVLVLGLLL